MESLREELLALPGVADAEIDLSGDNPSGVKIRLTADADADAVGAEVSRIFASHGMRSRLAGGDEGAPDPGSDPFDRSSPVGAPIEPEVPPQPSSPPPTVEARTPTAAMVTSMPEVLIRETEVGAEIIVKGEGRTASRAAGSRRNDLIGAALEAMAEVLGGDVAVIDSARLGDGPSGAVAVLVQRDGVPAVGATLVGITDAYAAARALWEALA